jgi:hypothetical protein
MAQAMEFAIGATASCPIVCCGGMSRMTVDPAARPVTHLVIEPKRRREPIGWSLSTWSTHGRRCVTGSRAALAGRDRRQRSGSGTRQGAA